MKSVLVLCALVGIAHADAPDPDGVPPMTGHVLQISPPPTETPPSFLTKTVRAQRLILDAEGQRDLIKAHRDEGWGVALDVLGITTMAVGTAFFIPLAVPDRNGGLTNNQSIAAGVVSTAVGAAILGVGIHLYRRGAVRETRAIDRAYKSGTLRLF
jgi:hypothetical protein